jgi:NitT/TauT family transport system permease protein
MAVFARDAMPVTPPVPRPSAARQSARAPSRWFPVRGGVAPHLSRSFAVLSGVVLLLGYAFLSHRDWVSSALLPTLSSVAGTGYEAVQSAEFWRDVEVSFLRVSAGFLAAAVLAVPLGILAGAFRLCSALLEPVSEFLRYIPVPALIPLVMIVLGIDENAKVSLVFLGTFFQLLLMTADEVRQVPLPLVQVSQSMGATRFEVVWRVLTPAALPGISNALRICNGWAWSYVVVAELLAATEGLGFRILRFYRFIQTPNIYVYLLTFGLIGLGLDALFRLVHRWLFRWAKAGRA